MSWAGALLAALLVVPGHSRSEGRSSFIVDEQGGVAVEITLGEIDLPELCDVNFLDDPAGRQRDVEERKLDRCLARDIPLLVRLKADGKPCRMSYDGFSANSGVVVIAASARCPLLPEELVIDWGLFSGSALDHVSVARVEQPHGEPQLVMLSKRSSRATVAIERRWSRAVLPAATALALLVVVGVLVVRLVRARDRRSA